MCDWLSVLERANKICIVDGNVKRINYQLEDGREFMEEYNTVTDTLTKRAWKNTKQLTGEEDWEIEVGDPEPSICKTELLIQESTCQPFLSRRNTKRSLEWRIKNLPYPANVYSVTVDRDQRCLVVRTTNKKYFKILKIPELDRLNLPLDQKNVAFQHRFNTLIISYQKPPGLIDFQRRVSNEVKKLNSTNSISLQKLSQND